MGTSPIPTPMLRTPPLGGVVCPDPVWGAGRALTLHGPSLFLGASWVLTAGPQGQPASGPIPPQPPQPPPTVEEGSIPWVDWV
jgi:hypothetical protein